MYKKTKSLSIERTVPMWRREIEMLIGSSDDDVRDGSARSGVSMNSFARFSTNRPGRNVSPLIQNTSAPVFLSFDTPDLRAIGILSANAVQGVLCALTTSHWGRSL